jgi:hypothetical protein
MMSVIACKSSFRIFLSVSAAIACRVKDNGDFPQDALAYEVQDENQGFP